MLRKALWTAALLLVGAGGAMQQDSCPAAQPGQPSDWGRYYGYHDV